MRKNYTYLFLLFFYSFYQIGVSQNTYAIKDTTITECKGYLTDSNKGDNGFGTYGNNEDYRFTICTSSPVTLTFYGQFCLEASTDTIRFFDGPNTSSPQIGSTYSGSTLPPAITAPSGCLTVHFKSDASATYCGWTARWASIIIPPIAPTVLFSNAPTCNTNQLALSFNNPIMCDSVKAKYFTVTGPATTSVSLANAQACSNGNTSAVQLNLTQPVSQNCTYTVISSVFMKDNCDSVWRFNLQSTFFINTCPFTASISTVGSTTVCEGSCVTLQAVPKSLCLNYNYIWSHGLPSTLGPHIVCPTVTTTYSVTLTESNTGNSYTATKQVVVSNPVIAPLPSSISFFDTICQSVIPFNLSASPTGGRWFGAGITNSVTGLFYPDTAGVGTHYIKYKISTCADSIKIVVKQLNAGFNDAGCVGGPNFQVSGGIPSGGSWSGSTYISATGNFSPTTAGNFTVMYSHPNGCSETKTISINTLMAPLNVDTICQSVWFDSLMQVVSPAGGRFYGIGITDSIYGVFNPTLAGAGIKVITYKLANGCATTFSLFVKPIYAQPWMSACPSQASFTLPIATPIGGTWSGDGVTNTTVGIYNPSLLGGYDRVDTTYYNATNGCQDTLLIWNVKTEIERDTLYFCDNDDSLRLRYSSIRNYPDDDGFFTGAGIINYGNKWYFKPSTAGVGVHTITYLKNSCSDTIKFIVYPAQLPNLDSLVCSTHSSFIIANLPPKAVWYGTGVNPTTGLFSPQTAGTGTFSVYYTTPSGCSDTVKITVYPFQTANITNLNSTYCFKDTNYILTLIPLTGTLTGLSATTNTLNPSVIGAGTYSVMYQFGSGECYTQYTKTITVYPAIQTTVSATKDTICNGEGTTISVTSLGGLQGSLHQYQWNNNLFPISSNNVAPSSNTSYIVTTYDGCSSPKIDTIKIVINTPFVPTINTSSLACYGNTGFANVSVLPTGNYSFLWNTSPTQTTSAITNAVAGKSYIIKIKNTTTGCLMDSLISIPSYPAIKALFSPNPNLSCLPFDDKLVTFLDLCNGADTGYWNFNGAIIPYNNGENPQYDFADAGNYNVTLTVTNSGNCQDSYSLPICILENTEVFIPDIFSPNNDGKNDVLYVRGKGIKELKFTLYDRWGEKIFETNDTNTGWDGTYKSMPATQAVYFYYLEATLKTDKKIIQKGDVSLIR